MAMNIVGTPWKAVIFSFVMQASPFEGWAGTLLISGGEEGTPGKGGPWPAGEHRIVSGSASFPEKAGAGFVLKGLWSPVHHLPWVLFN